MRAARGNKPTHVKASIYGMAVHHGFLSAAGNPRRSSVCEVHGSNSVLVGVFYSTALKTSSRKYHRLLSANFE